MAEKQDPPGLAGVIWKEVKSFFTIMFTSVWSGFVPMQDKSFAQWLARWRGYTAVDRKTDWSNWLDGYVKAGFLSEADKQGMMKLEGGIRRYNWLVIPLAWFGLLLAVLTTPIMAAQKRIQRGYFKVVRPENPHYAEILAAALVAPEKTGEIREIAKQHGLTDKAIDLLFLNLYRTYEEGTIRTLWLRKVLNDDEMYMRMRELGYTDTRIKEIIQSWTLLPPPGDLFTMVAHEAFEPEIYKPLGLDKEFPSEQVKWLQQQGISEEWAKKYWIAHWDQPSIGQGFEMLHRGVINQATLDMLFKAIEIPEFWRDKLTAIAYNPYTRVDTRRMHNLGILTEKDVITSYLDQGYDVDKAAKMAEFTIRYNEEEDRDLTKTEILSIYRTGAIDSETAVGHLKDIRYSETHANTLIAYEDYKVAVELVNLQIDNVRDRFISSLLSRPDAKDRLDALNLPSKQVTGYLDRWELQSDLGKHMPSKTDLNKFWLLKIISDDDYVKEMVKLGYEYKYIQWYQSLVKKTGKA